MNNFSLGFIERSFLMRTSLIPRNCFFSGKIWFKNIEISLLILDGFSFIFLEMEQRKIIWWSWENLRLINEISLLSLFDPGTYSWWRWENLRLINPINLFSLCDPGAYLLKALVTFGMLMVSDESTENFQNRHIKIQWKNNWSLRDQVSG